MLKELRTHSGSLESLRLWSVTWHFSSWRLRASGCRVTACFRSAFRPSSGSFPGCRRAGRTTSNAQQVSPAQDGPNARRLSRLRNTLPPAPQTKRAMMGISMGAVIAPSRFRQHNSALLVTAEIGDAGGSPVIRSDHRRSPARCMALAAHVIGAHSCPAAPEGHASFAPCPRHDGRGPPAAASAAPRPGAAPRCAAEASAA